MLDYNLNFKISSFRIFKANSIFIICYFGFAQHTYSLIAYAVGVEHHGIDFNFNFLSFINSSTASDSP